MPLYDFKCKNCKTVSEKYARVDEREKKCQCGGDMERLITTKFFAHSDMKPYLDENIGSEPIWIKGKQHRKQVMKQNGVSEKIGSGWI